MPKLVCFNCESDLFYTPLNRKALLNPILAMVKITCEQCGSTIAKYYNKNYNGKRGKCYFCGVEFPLD